MASKNKSLFPELPEPSLPGEGQRSCLGGTWPVMGVPEQPEHQCICFVTTKPPSSQNLHLGF